MNISWTPDRAVQWQNFYNNALRVAAYGRSGFLNYTLLPKISDYVDLKQANCTAQQNQYNPTNISFQCDLATHQKIFLALFLFI
jgi:hypothetical protein